MTLTNVRTAPQALQRSFDETAEGLCVSPEYCQVIRVTEGTNILPLGGNIVGVTVSWGAGAATILVSADGVEVITLTSAVAGAHRSWIPSMPVRLTGDVRVEFTGAGAVVYVYYTDLR